MKLNVDVFSNPTLKAAMRTLVEVNSERDHLEKLADRRIKFLKNEVSNAVETKLVEMGVYANTQAALDGCFHVDNEYTKLTVHGEDHDTLLKEIVLVEAPELKKIFTDYGVAYDAVKKEIKPLEDEAQKVHQETWDAIRNELVALGHFTAEEAVKEQFTIKDGRFIRIMSAENMLKKFLKDILN